MLPHQGYIMSGPQFSDASSGVDHVRTLIQCCVIRRISCWDPNLMLANQGHIIPAPLFNVSGVYHLNTFIQCCLIKRISCRDLHSMQPHQEVMMSRLLLSIASSGVYHIGTLIQCCLIRGISCPDLHSMLPYQEYIILGPPFNVAS